MSRNRNNRNPGKYNYNRQSAGYQKNLYRQKLNTEGIKMPKPMDPKKMRIVMIVLAVLWLIGGFFLIRGLRWWGLLIAALIGAALVGGMMYYINYKQKEMIRYYKKVGMTEQMYLSELKRRGTDKKQIDTFIKLWRKTEV